MHLNGTLRRWLPWLLLAVAVVATGIVYWPGVTGGWVFDDYPNIVDNAAIHIQTGHATLVAWVNAALSSPASFLHRPLASITFALNWMQGGGDPYPFKVTNIAIHLLNGVLVFVMLRALLRLLAWRWEGLGSYAASAANASPTISSFWGGPQGRTRNPASLAAGQVKSWIPGSSADEAGAGPGMTSLGRTIDDAAATRLALIVAAAWMLLPINLMAVLYVVQRMESLCQVFVLAGLWAYLHGRWMMLTASSPGRDRRGLALAICGIVFGTLLGLTSKETAVLLPVFAFFVELILLRFARSARGQSRIPVSGSGAAVSPGRTSQKINGRSGVARSAEPGIHAVPASTDPDDPKSWIPGSASGSAAGSPGMTKHGNAARGSAAGQDIRLWVMFTLALFIPAILGFLWLLRGVLRPAALAGRDFTLGQRLITEPRVLVDYLKWTLFPNPNVLSLYHDEIKISTGILTPASTLGAMLLLAVLIVIAVWLRNRRPLVSLGIAWFFSAQLLTATIIPLELVYEQRMYFASIGVLLAAAALIAGLRWRVRLPLLRGLVVIVALGWFAIATNLRAQEWSNPIRLAVAEANRHPESPRAVYEAGRLLLIASNYKPGPAMDGSEKYLGEASRIPGASTLPDQALIMLVDHGHQGDDAEYWASMAHKLANQPTRQEDISALISLTNCYGAGICKFDVANLDRAYKAALSRPYPIARLDGAYADFQRDILRDDPLAIVYLARAVKGAPSEPAYRIDLAALYARNDEPDKALQQIAALRTMNFAGRLDRQIAVLEQLVAQAKSAAPAAH
ncbi:MAG: tetratricopeptide repeat protein [Rhodanobacteraceae bacterium]